MNATAEATFGELLRQYRGRAGLTQEALAEAAGLSVRGLIYLERGRRQPYPDTVQRLAAALGLAEPERAALFQAARQARSARVPRPTPPLTPPPASVGAAPTAVEADATLPPPSRAALLLAPSGAGVSWPATPLLGRERESEELRVLLRRGDVRLLTVTGPAGVGKTHLALQVAAALQDQFAHGVVLVSLAPMRDAALVLPALAQALGVRETHGLPLLDALCAALASQERLLVLDNCEQVVEAAPHLASLLAACRHLRLLATSRTPLRLRAEQEYPLAPLALPDLTALPPVEELAQVPAVALFVARAQAIKPGFTLTATNARAVAEVCVRLDGLPLAIELVAARLKLFAPRELAARLERRLPLLVGGAGDLPERQRTMRAALAWSHALLPMAEQALFRRLAVFVGGATLEAVLALATGRDAGTGPDEHPAGGALDEAEVLAWLEGLIDHNLLRVNLTSEGEPRYGMLETLREYGLEQLAASGEEERVRQQHSYYYLTQAERAQGGFIGSEQTYWLERVDREHENLWMAAHWLIAHGEVEHVARLTAALGLYWTVRGRRREGRELLDAFLAVLGGTRSVARAKALGHAGMLALWDGDLAAAARLLQESLTLARDLDDQEGTSEVLAGLGYLASLQGDHPTARRLLEEGLAVMHEGANAWLRAWTLTFLSEVCLAQGEIQRGRMLCEEVVALRRALGDQQGLGIALGLLAAAYRIEGDHAGARALLEEELTLQRLIDDRLGIPVSLFRLGSLAREQGRATEACRCYMDGLRAWSETASRRPAMALLAGLAALSAATAPARALRLAAAAEAAGRGIAIPLSMVLSYYYPSVEPAQLAQLLDDARQSVGVEVATAVWAEGEAMTLEQAIAYSLEGEPAFLP